MPRQIVLDFAFDPDDPNSMKVWAFAEDLYRVFRLGGRASVDPQEADKAKANRQLIVTVRSEQWVRRTLQVIEDLLTRHFLRERATVTAIPPQN